MLQKCGCHGRTFQDWQEAGFTQSVATAQGVRGRQLMVSIEQFCASTKSWPEGLADLTGQHIHEDCGTVCGLAEALVKETLPSIFDELAGQFKAACLESQDWWKQAVPSGIMPRNAPLDFWVRAAAHELPSEKIKCLESVREACNSSQSVLNDCRRSYDKAVVMQSLCQVQSLMISQQLTSSPSLETLSDTLPKLQKPCQNMVAAVLKLADDPSRDQFSAEIVRLSVEPISGDVVNALSTYVNKVLWNLVGLPVQKYDGNDSVMICDIRYQISIAFEVENK